MNDNFIYQFQKNPGPSFTNTLYAQLNTMPGSKIIPFRRNLVTGMLATALVLVGTFLVYPPARALASNVSQQIGHLLILAEETFAAQFDREINSSASTRTFLVSQEPVPWQPAEMLSVADASSRAGFQAVVPVDLPAGFDLSARTTAPADELNPFTSITTIYSHAEDTFTLIQKRYASPTAHQTLPVGDAKVTDQTVQGVDGYWIEGLRLSTYVDEANHVSERYANVLVWQKGDQEFWLQSSPGLPLDVMLSAANSITE